MVLLDFKNNFSKDTNYTHLNNAGQCLIPKAYLEVAIKWLDRFYQEGAHCALEGWAQVESVRTGLAKFVGAKPEELAFFQTTAAALSQAAFSIPINHGDEILTWEQEYPSNYYPWREVAKQKGAKLIQVSSEQFETPYQKILDKVTNNTKAIAISWVQYQSGATTDLLALSHALKNRGIWLIADAVQGVGVQAFDFQNSGFDIACFGTHKWLCGGYAAGIFLCRRDRLDELSPLSFGAMTFGNPDTPKGPAVKMKEDARKFEPGSKAMIEILGLGASVELIAKVGIQKISAEANRLTALMKDQLISKNYQVIYHGGSILNFYPQDAKYLETIANSFMNSNISFAKRGPGIRLSFHAYNSEKDIEKVLESLPN